ncbi:MAG: methyltransferase domain-containing protein [Chthoniobacter sp.]|uniref:class I SAM-dependent methyltransferase n=1 Tax=Chthoniobacter sp. TaxID=2510640 RepID=UPI0032AE4F29
MATPDEQPPIDILERSRADWNRESRAGSCRWCIPVDHATIERARAGDWEVVLTPTLPVPRAWFGELRGRDVLCLASGGGQQAPTFAAAGARVTSYDLSEEQLAKDQLVADREGLPMTCLRGNMADLAALADASFDLIFHPVSNVFAEDVRPVWAECFRVLRPGGVLLAGFLNPLFFIFDHYEAEQSGRLVVKYPLPFSDVTSHDPAGRERWLKSGMAAEFSHSLDDQIGAQLKAGFVLTGLYEDRWTDDATPLNRYCPMFLATRALKLA